MRMKMEENKEELLKFYLAMAREHGRCASQYWHTDLLIWLTKIWKPKVIVDLGTFCGGSFYCFLFAITEIENCGHIYTIDCVDRNDKLPKTSKTSFTHIINNTLNVDIKEKIDFLFIDDDHTYKHVMDEWGKFEKQVNVGGLIFFHDSISTRLEPNGEPCGVSEALKELWNKHKDRFVRLVNSGAIINGDTCGLEIWLKIR